MTWNYAELSQFAKANGGPEKLVDILIKSGMEKGFKEGAKSRNPYIAAAFAAGGFFTAGGIYLYSKIKKQSETVPHVDSEVVKVAESELIKGINEYDKNHSGNPDESDETESV